MTERVLAGVPASPGAAFGAVRRLDAAGEIDDAGRTRRAPSSPRRASALARDGARSSRSSPPGCATAGPTRRTSSTPGDDGRRSGAVDAVESAVLHRRLTAAERDRAPRRRRCGARRARRSGARRARRRRPQPRPARRAARRAAHQARRPRPAATRSSSPRTSGPPTSPSSTARARDRAGRWRRHRACGDRGPRARAADGRRRSAPSCSSGRRRASSASSTATTASCIVAPDELRARTGARRDVARPRRPRARAIAPRATCRRSPRDGTRGRVLANAASPAEVARCARRGRRGRRSASHRAGVPRRDALADRGRAPPHARAGAAALAGRRRDGPPARFRRRQDAALPAGVPERGIELLLAASRRARRAAARRSSRAGEATELRILIPMVTSPVRRSVRAAHRAVAARGRRRRSSRR